MYVSNSLLRKTVFAAGVFFLVTAALCAEGLFLEQGIYSNTHQMIIVSDSSPSSKVYETFNTFWCDGPYQFDPDAVTASPVAQIQDGLYLDFCIRYPADRTAAGITGVWLPGGNSTSLSVNGGQNATARKNRLTGYYISDSGEVWSFPYWKAAAEFNPDEKAFLTITDDEMVTVQKKVLVGNQVYTCTVGRSTKIRNPERCESSLLENAKVSSDSQILSFAQPLYIKTPYEVDDLDSLIAQRNTTVYPPRFLWVYPVEPSIYKILEQR